MADMQMKLELVIIPVSDVDRAKAFYTEKIGFNADYDQRVSEQLRFVQLTPQGSACSVAIGEGLSDMQPGLIKGLQVVVSDVRAIREELIKRGVEISEVDVLDWGDFAYFDDPDGNHWSLQQLPKRS
jgi:catechol 2,3-dioxygenase-like lactoylglutathione lyase family enzyme